MGSNKNSTNIKIRIDTKKRLEALLEPGETYDQLINRLIDRVRELEEKAVALERELAFREEQARRLAKAEALEEVVIRSIDAVMLDRACWYITKLIFSVQSLKELVLGGASPVEIDNQMNRLAKICQQIRERYRVDISTLLDVAKQFVYEPSKENLVLLNEATKETIKHIFIRMLGLQIAR